MFACSHLVGLCKYIYHVIIMYINGSSETSMWSAGFIIMCYLQIWVASCFIRLISVCNMFQCSDVVTTKLIFVEAVSSNMEDVERKNGSCVLDNFLLPRSRPRNVIRLPTPSSHVWESKWEDGEYMCRIPHHIGWPSCYPVRRNLPLALPVALVFVDVQTRHAIEDHLAGRNAHGEQWLNPHHKTQIVRSRLPWLTTKNMKEYI